MPNAVKFQVELHKFKFDKKGFTASFDKQAQILVRQAARAWLRAVILEVRVWTGFALGSIKFARGPNGNLGQFLRVSIPISPVSERPKYYYHSDGRRIPKTPERAGVLGKYNFPTAQRRYRFSFRSDVVHFLANEFFESVSQTSPWHSMKAGREAFREYITAHSSDLPHVNSFIVKSPSSRRL